MVGITPVTKSLFRAVLVLNLVKARRARLCAFAVRAADVADAL